MATPTVSLAAVGDISFADSAYCIGHGLRSLIDRVGTGEMASRLRGLVRPSDILLANLETVYSDEGRRQLALSTLEMRSDPRHLPLIGALGVRVANMANNHSFQHGERAYRDTVDSLERLGVAVVGDEGPHGSRVASIEVRKLAFHFVGFSLRPEQYFPHNRPPYSRREPAELLREVASIRKRCEGHLVCSVHWGHEFLDTPSEEQRELAHALIDEGVTLVLGHHPHVLQGVEPYRSGLIAYSLGNFAFDLREEVTRDTICLHVRIDRNGVAGWDVQPIRLSEDGWPEVCGPIDDARILEQVKRLSSGVLGSLPTGECLTAREMVRQLQRSRWTHRYFLRNLWRYNALLAAQSLGRAALRRVGLIHNP